MIDVLKMLAGMNANGGEGESPLSTMQQGIRETVQLLTELRDELKELNATLKQTTVVIEPKSDDRVN